MWFCQITIVVFILNKTNSSHVLQVPSFNGSSYLRYPGLASSALSWLDLMIIFKPSANDGVIIYNGHRTDGVGDFMAVYMIEGHPEFTFDLGTGAATLR